MRGLPVWEQASYDVIQAKILKNIFENDVVLCDISTRNPNVMLELGMRLTTKKPTIVVAENGTPLPFDTGIIETEFYDPRLEYGSIDIFISKVAERIVEIRRAVSDEAYKPFMAHFQFETVEPATVSVSAEVLIEGRIAEVMTSLRRIESGMNDARNTKSLLPAALTGVVNTASLTPSFTEALTSPLPDMPVGTQVFHQKFGRGLVVEVQGGRMEVDFEIVGRKRVMSSFLTHSR